MLTFDWSWLFVLGLILLGFFVAFGWTFGAWVAATLLGLLRRGG